MQRPRTVSRLALILTLIGTSALAGIVGVHWSRPLPVAPQLLRIDPTATSHVLFGASVVYCAATLLCAFALWRMRPWAPAAYAWFVASITAYMVIFLYLVRVPTPVVLGLAFFGLLGAGLYLGWRIVRKAFGPAANAL
jgi:hypothetical protein